MFKALRSGWRGLRKRLFGAPAPLVTVLRLTGPIGPSDRFRQSLNAEGLSRQISQAFQPDGLSAVALVINSPGGSPAQSALIVDQIRRLAEEKSVPVLAFAEDVAASGGYMLMLAGDELFAHETSLIGSIGVVAMGFGFVDALGKLGLERRLYTQGENKVRLDPFQPEKEEDRAWILSLQKDIHEVFKTMVRERRGDKLKGKRAELFSGDVWTGPRALRLGLVDGLGTADGILKERFGKKVRLKPIEAKKPLLASLAGAGAASRPAPLEAVWSALHERLLWQRWGL